MEKENKFESNKSICMCIALVDTKYNTESWKSLSPVQPHPEIIRKEKKIGSKKIEKKRGEQADNRSPAPKPRGVVGKREAGNL